MDDIMHNTLGCLIGFMIVALLTVMPIHRHLGSSETCVCKKLP